MAPAAMYETQAYLALLEHLNVVKRLSLEKVNKEAHRLCNHMGLSKLARDITTSKARALRLFSSAKNHTLECPFLLISSEKDSDETWFPRTFTVSYLGLISVIRISPRIQYT